MMVIVIVFGCLVGGGVAGIWLSLQTPSFINCMYTATEEIKRSEEHNV